MGRFETEILATNENLAALSDLGGTWIDRVHDRRPPKTIVLDIDSSVSPTFGERQGSAWNGHFRCTCYHPLFVFNQFGDLERCALCPGNVHSADGFQCECGEQIRGVILFKGCRGEVGVEAVRVGPDQTVGFRILEVSSDVFLRMSAYP